MTSSMQLASEQPAVTTAWLYRQQTATTTRSIVALDTARWSRGTSQSPLWGNRTSWLRSIKLGLQ